MRRLSRAQEQMLAEYDRDMAAIRRDRERAGFTRKPIHSSARTPAPPPPRRVSTPAVVQRVGYADGRPHLVCRICLEPAHVGRSFTCSRCAAEVGWRVSLARQGLRVVS